MASKKRLANLERKVADLQPGGCELCRPGREPIAVTREEICALALGTCPRCGRRFDLGFCAELSAPTVVGAIDRCHASVLDGKMCFTFAISGAGGPGPPDGFVDPTADWSPGREGEYEASRAERRAAREARCDACPRSWAH